MRYIVPIYIKLKKINITKISSFNYLNWRNGYCYFKGVYLEKEVFIKVDTKMHLLINDKLTYDICKDIMKDELVEILHHSLDSRIQFIVYEFFNSIELDENILLNDMRYLDGIIRILNNLSKAGIIHRDIKLDNFLVSKDKLKVIDFTFSNSITHKDFKEVDVNNSYNCFLLEFLGAGLNPSPFVWDDYYSFCTILKKLEKDADDFQKVKLNACIKEIEKFIGKTEYSIQCGTQYYFFIRQLKIKIKELLRIDHKYRVVS
jgi:serine/threonine protein kinase